MKKCNYICHALAPKEETCNLCGCLSCPVCGESLIIKGETQYYNHNCSKDGTKVRGYPFSKDCNNYHRFLDVYNLYDVQIEKLKKDEK